MGNRLFLSEFAMENNQENRRWLGDLFHNSNELGNVIPNDRFSSKIAYFSATQDQGKVTFWIHRQAVQKR
jgi:hypothetical protein